MGVIEGEAAGSMWGVDAGDLYGNLFPLYRGPALPGNAYGAVSPAAAADRCLWTVNDELVLTDGDFVELRRVALNWSAVHVPASPSRPDLADSDFLIAGRSNDATEVVGMRVERRRGTDLEVVSRHYLDAYDALVESPEPRGLVGHAGVFALVWVAQRFPGEPTSFACLYATPLDEDGAPSGPAVRIDDAPAPLDVSSVEHVRVIARDGSFFVLWQRQPDMWLARVDHAER
jgi:hypothetical protein